MQPPQPPPPLKEQRNMPPPRRQPGGSGPAAARAKNGGWGGSTHTADRARAIDRENAHLVKHLTKIATAPRTSSHFAGRGSAPPPAAPKVRASASINRQRQNDQIAQENARLAKRLAGAKPAIANHKEHAAKQDAYKRNASRSQQVRSARQPTHPPAQLPVRSHQWTLTRLALIWPGRTQWGAWAAAVRPCRHAACRRRCQ